MSEDKKSGAKEYFEEENSRRTFMKAVGLFGAGAVAGGAAIYAGFEYEVQKGNNEYVTILTEDNRLERVPKSDLKKLKPDMAEMTDLQKRGREGIKGRRWVMVIDLARCRNARDCVRSCQAAHDLHPYQYHINTLVMQDNPNSAPYNMPKPCMHCDNAPCVSVCPVDATFKRQDGIVLIDNERCIGCRFCMAACPYSVRIFNWEKPIKSEIYAEEKPEYDVELNVPQRKGTISKCLFSADRLREGKMPYCVSACKNGVFWFGDENEDAVTNGTTKETTRLSELLEKNGGYRLMEELGTKPRVFYLPAKNRIFDVPNLPDESHYA